MRIRDILQIGQNFASNTDFSVDFGPIKISVKGSKIWDIHSNPIVIQQIVSECFCERRVFWQNFAHEFKFLPQEQHRFVIIGSIERFNIKLSSARDKIQGSSSQEAWLLQILQFLLSAADLFLRQIEETPTWEAYNKWNDSIDPFNEDKRMTSGEETDNLIALVKGFRKETYGAWDSLIDFLNDGPVKSDARKKFEEGLFSINLVYTDVEPNWAVISAR